MKKPNKPTYRIEDELLAEVSVVVKVNLQDLGIPFSHASRQQLLASILKELEDSLFEASANGCTPILYKAKLLNQTVTTKSVLVDSEEDFNKN